MQRSYVSASQEGRHPSSRRHQMMSGRNSCLQAGVLAGFLVLTACTPDVRPSRIDPQLAAEIARIKAIDNHAHPVRPVAQGEKPDDEYDAMPVETLEPSSDPVRLRPKSPELLDAQRRLFGGDKAKAARTYGQDYAVKVLDQLG